MKITIFHNPKVNYILSAQFVLGEEKIQIRLNLYHRQCTVVTTNIFINGLY